MSTPSTKSSINKDLVDTEEDLDDLDDVLSEFSSGKQPGQSSASLSTPPPPPPPSATTSTSTSNTATSTGGPKGRLRTNTRVDAPPESIPGPVRKSKLDSTTEEAEEDEILSSDDFARELAREMENLVREIAGPAAGAEGQGAGSDGSNQDKDKDEEERARAFKAAWEAMLIEGMNANLGLGEDGLPSDPSAQNNATGGSSSSSGAGTSFQDRIRQTREKLKESESKLKGSQGAAGTSDLPATDAETLQELLKTLGDLGLGEGGDGAEGDGSEEQLAGFLENMMGQLMSKEVLYEPLKELADNFPPYLENPPNPLSSEDKTRYDKQLTCVRKILAVFEKEEYSDDKVECSRQIVDLMSEMQSYGTPPPEIMGPLPPGFDGTNPLLGGAGDENCTIA
ncbi:hypothetical protein CVT26_013559 [Gymnopilus dilepis]|uniref:Uncharacterized protein n=1 Tax=Gymnopilus dilepis TaxID=231916 RepID=A0A409YWW4_9AGAR|nr:hypothetical protein CVT26_013559 [Gymnopilus dilepis]